LPAPQILGVDQLANDVILHIAPANPQWSARIRVSGVGMLVFAREFVTTPGQTDVSLGRSLDPDTQYSVRVAWDTSPNAANGANSVTDPTAKSSLPPFPQPSATLSASSLKVIAPRYAQPLNRVAGPVAGPGWTSLLSAAQQTTRRNPCAPWRIVYDERNAPVDFEARIQIVIAQTAEAAGVQIIYGGKVSGPTTDPRDIRVSWDTSSGATLGLARQSFVRDAGGTVWRTVGSITMAGRRRGITPDRWQAVFLHELGHIAGLDHTNNNTSPMFSPVESGENWPYAALEWTYPDRDGLKAMNGGLITTCAAELTDPNAQ
jgi:hypothetical protein